MGLNAGKLKLNTTSSRTPQEALEPDSYPARVVQVLDLGVQPQRPFQGQEKPPKHEIMLTYELTDAFMKDENGEDDPEKPRWISERFPILPLQAERAKSTQRYKAIDKANKFEGDFAKLIGAPCSVLVTQYKSAKDGIVRNGVGAVSPVMRGTVLPELVNEGKVFSLEDPDIEVFRSLPEWLQDLIKSNLEFRGSHLESLLEGAPAPKEKAPAPEPKAKPAPKKAEPVEEDEDDLPWD